MAGDRWSRWSSWWLAGTPSSAARSPRAAGAPAGSTCRRCAAAGPRGSPRTPPRPPPQARRPQPGSLTDLRQLDDEPGAAARTLLHPRPAVVAAHVLADQRQAQPGAAVAGVPVGGGAAGEALEDVLAGLDRDARTGVVDLDAGPAVAAQHAKAHQAL